MNGANLIADASSGILNPRCNFPINAPLTALVPRSASCTRPKRVTRNLSCVSDVKSQTAKRTRGARLFSKVIATMDDLLLHGLKDLYYAENQIVKSLPKLIDKSTNRDLTKGLSDHLEETRNQMGRPGLEEAGLCRYLAPACGSQRGSSMKIVLLALWQLLHPVMASAQNLIPPEVVRFENVHVDGDVSAVSSCER